MRNPQLGWLLGFLFAISACSNQSTFYYSPDQNKSKDSEKLISVSAPIYPAADLSAGIEGYVIFKFSINTHGRVENAEVVKSYPDNRFVSAALASINSSIYKPRYVNGKPVRVEDKVSRVSFVISGQHVVDVPLDERNCENSRPEWVKNKSCKKIQ